MNVARVLFHSKSLDRTIEYLAILPDPEVVGPGPYPVLAMLHGYLDDHNAWLYKSMFWNHFERYPMIAVLPSTHNGWWSNLGYPNNWEDFVVKDLVAHVRQTFPARPGPWAIGGLSMGGFGALRLGLRHPDLFRSVWAHSSAIFDPAVKLEMPVPMLWDDPARSAEERDRLRVELDCYHWARQLDPARAPRISFDCGTEDFLISQNRAFHTFLEERKIPHHYAEHPGAHTWDYWNTHVVTALAQHAEVFGVTRAPEPQWGA